MDKMGLGVIGLIVVVTLLIGNFGVSQATVSGLEYGEATKGVIYDKHGSVVGFTNEYMDKIAAEENAKKINLSNFAVVMLVPLNNSTK